MRYERPERDEEDKVEHYSIPVTTLIWISVMLFGAVFWVALYLVS